MICKLHDYSPKMKILSQLQVLNNSFDDVPDSYKEGFIIPEELRQKVEAEVLI